MAEPHSCFNHLGMPIPVARSRWIGQSYLEMISRAEVYIGWVPVKRSEES
jgi:hypothetical protein